MNEHTKPAQEDDHGGLRILKNLNVKTMTRELGEQKSIELISGLISGKMRNVNDALELVEKSGLL